MTSKEALSQLKYITSMAYSHELPSVYQQTINCIEVIEKDLEMIEILKHIFDCETKSKKIERIPKYILDMLRLFMSFIV